MYELLMNELLETDTLLEVDRLWILESLSYLAFLLFVIAAYKTWRRYLDELAERDADLAEEVAAHEKRQQGVGLREAA